MVLIIWPNIFNGVSQGFGYLFCCLEINVFLIVYDLTYIRLRDPSQPRKLTLPHSLLDHYFPNPIHGEQVLSAYPVSCECRKLYEIVYNLRILSIWDHGLIRNKAKDWKTDNFFVDRFNA